MSRRHGLANSFLAAAFLVVIFARPAWAAARAGDPPGSGCVGKFGDLSTIAIEGCKAVPENDVRLELRRCIAVQLAAAPATPIDEFVTAVKSNLLAGYFASGFPYAKVDVRLDDAGNPAAIVVDEGKQFLHGPVRLVGAKNIPIDRLSQLLTRSVGFDFKVDVDATQRSIQIGQPVHRGDKAKIPWETGKAAGFDPDSRQSLDNLVRVALQQAGFFRAEFTTELVPKDDRAELVINITDEGDTASISKIEVTGNKRNDAASILSLVNLKEGQAVDLDRLFAIQQALWDSGRFKRHVLTMNASADRPGEHLLRIDLIEHPDIPPLTEKLSETDQAILKVRQWAESLEKSSSPDDEFLMSFGDDDLAATVAVQPRGGFAIWYRTKNANIDFALRVHPGELTVFSPAARQQYTFHFPGMPLNVKCSFLPSFENEDRWRSFDLAGGVSSADEAKQGDSMKLLFRIAPVVLLDFTHSPQFTVELKDGVLNLKSASSTTRVDAASGRILEITSGIIRGEFGRGAFAKLVDRLNADAPQVKPFARTEAIEAAASAAIAQTGVLDSRLPEGKRARAANALAKLSAAILDPSIDALADLYPITGGIRDFHIPGDHHPRDMAATMAGVAIWFPDALAPHGSWPWSLLHENLFAIAGPRTGIAREIERLAENPKTGPIACLAFAMSPMRSDPFSRGLATIGKSRLNADACVLDLRPFYEGEATSARIGRNVVAQLQKMDPADVETVGELLPETWRATLIDFAAALRAAPAEDPSVAIPRAVKQIWEPRLRPALEQSFDAMK